MVKPERMTLERTANHWRLDGRSLRDGGLVEVYDAEHAAWRPAVVVRDATAVEYQDSSDADAGHKAADPEENLTLEHMAEAGIGLRWAEVGARADAR